jgi:hypothetical protein
LVSRMGIGMRLRKLWTLRVGVTLSLALAVLVSVWSVEKISLSPLTLTPRSLEMASASTHVVVDTPTSTLLDLRQDTYSLEALTNRAVILGNVIANGEVRQAIAARAGVPVEVLQITAPLTRQQPAARVEDGKQQSTSDIFKSTDQYRLSIQANPTVPLLDIYAQAPNAATAEILANSAVDELRSYLTTLAASEKTPADAEIQLMQLGRARGAIINGGIRWQVAMLAFVLTFVLSCGTLLFVNRVREGWRVATRAEAPAGV